MLFDKYLMGSKRDIHAANAMTSSFRKRKAKLRHLSPTWGEIDDEESTCLCVFNVYGFIYAHKYVITFYDSSLKPHM